MSEKRKGFVSGFQAILKGIKEIGKTMIGEPAKLSTEVFKTNSFIRAFLEESKFSPKPNYEKRTAEAVEGIHNYLKEREK